VLKASKLFHQQASYMSLMGRHQKYAKAANTLIFICTLLLFVLADFFLQFSFLQREE
jgi:hypothetical protein